MSHTTTNQHNIHLQDDASREAAPLYTENDFFKVLESDMEKVQNFTRAQVLAVCLG